MTQWLPVFITLFLGELGDKTQVATLFFAADGSKNPWLLFVVASLALTASTGLATLLGHFGGRYIDHIPLRLISGCGFVLMGLWVIFDHFRTTS